MEDTPIALRLKSLISALGLSDSQFADQCSISRSTLSLLLSGKNKKISDVILSQIHDTFPRVSILWLLFGEGDKFIKENTSSSELNHGFENSLFQDEGKEEDEQLNLVNLKQLEQVVQDVVNKSFDTSFITLQNIMQKNSEPAIPRKVRQITVYYDDSTFETFVPDR